MYGTVRFTLLHGNDHGNGKCNGYGHGNVNGHGHGTITVVSRDGHSGFTSCKFYLNPYY